MKKRVASYLLILSLFSILIGCSEKDQITPSFEPIPIKDKYSFSLPIDSKVDVFAEGIDDLEPDVSDVYRRLAETLANTFIERESGVSAPLTAKSFNFPGLDKINMDYIKAINLDKIRMKIPSTNPQENFDFIKKVKIYMLPLKAEMTVAQGETQGLEEALNPHEQEIAANPDSRVKYQQEYLEKLKNKATTVMIFDKSFMVLGCSGRCFIFKNNSELNWKKFLEEYNTFTIITEVEVEAVPEDGFEFVGQIDFSIEINTNL